MAPPSDGIVEEVDPMARRSRMSIVKRQRELKKSEKAASKRAKRFGEQIPGLVEPRPTVGRGALGEDAEEGDLDGPNDLDDPSRSLEETP